MPRISRFRGTAFMTAKPPQGFGIRFTVEDDGSIAAQTVFDESKEGGDGILHGGAIAAVLDEAMGVAAYEAGQPGYTVTMTYTYKSHIPLGEPITIAARVDRIEGRKVFASCEAILPDQTIAVQGHGVFVASAVLKAQLDAAPYDPDSTD